MWAALISQTGKELADICDQLQTQPNIILTTKKQDNLCDRLQQIVLEKRINLIYIPFSQSKNTTLLFKYLKNCNLITLHGWLSIIPSDLCDIFDIYNGHPGDIESFPELKGKDPQVRAYDLKLPVSGSVIHKVTPEVDDGPIQHKIMTSIQGCTLDAVYERLRYSSLLSWKLFLTDQLPELRKAKYGITGAHCTGKTTLVNAIQGIDKQNKYEYITSMTREAKDLGFKINEAGNDETQLYILNKHLERLTLDRPCVLDRSIIDGYTYTKILYEAGNISEYVMKYAKSLLNIRYMNKYNKIFYLPPTLQLIDDGLRSTEPKFRQHIINNFDHIIQCASIFTPNLIQTIDGSVSERVVAIDKYLNIL